MYKAKSTRYENADWDKHLGKECYYNPVMKWTECFKMNLLRMV
jgi:hypothetical protein